MHIELTYRHYPSTRLLLSSAWSPDDANKTKSWTAVPSGLRRSSEQQWAEEGLRDQQGDESRASQVVVVLLRVTWTVGGTGGPSHSTLTRCSSSLTGILPLHSHRRQACLQSLAQILSPSPSLLSTSLGADLHIIQTTSSSSLPPTLLSAYFTIVLHKMQTNSSHRSQLSLHVSLSYFTIMHISFNLKPMMFLSISYHTRPKFTILSITRHWSKIFSLHIHVLLSPGSFPGLPAPRQSSAEPLVSSLTRQISQTYVHSPLLFKSRTLTYTVQS